MDISLPQTIAKVTVALAPAFACGFAVQQALQIIDPLVSKPQMIGKPNGANIKRAIMGLISLTLGLLIAYLGNVEVIQPLSKAADSGPLTLPGWLGISVNALIISAGTVLLRGAAEPSKRPSRFLTERSGDFAGDTAPHNRDIILGQIDRSNDDAVLSVDGNEAP